jgi:hypothetical protein
LILKQNSKQLRLPLDIKDQRCIRNQITINELKQRIDVNALSTWSFLRSLARIALRPVIEVKRSLVLQRGNSR